MSNELKSAAERKDVVFRRKLDASQREDLAPFTMYAWGLRYLETNKIESDVENGIISMEQGNDKITEMMEEYYGSPYPLRG